MRVGKAAVAAKAGSDQRKLSGFVAATPDLPGRI